MDKPRYHLVWYHFIRDLLYTLWGIPTFYSTIDPSSDLDGHKSSSTSLESPSIYTDFTLRVPYFYSRMQPAIGAQLDVLEDVEALNTIYRRDPLTGDISFDMGKMVGVVVPKQVFVDTYGGIALQWLEQHPYKAPPMKRSQAVSEWWKKRKTMDTPTKKKKKSTKKKKTIHVKQGEEVVIKGK